MFASALFTGLILEGDIGFYKLPQRQVRLPMNLWQQYQYNQLIQNPSLLAHQLGSKFLMALEGLPKINNCYLLYMMRPKRYSQGHQS
jgi:hypothetical protein